MVRVKICGLTNVEDALCATEAGADLLGFIFYAKSPRAATLEDARLSVRAAKQLNPNIVSVGVFVNESQAEIEHVMREASLDAAQLHGDETSERVASFHGQAYKAIKRIAAQTDAHISAGPIAGSELSIPALLLDADHATLYGGSGQRANASAAHLLARRCNLLLAGGLTPGNVAEAIRMVHPWGVDVASGTEASPGRKDHGKVRAFIAAVRASDNG